MTYKFKYKRRWFWHTYVVRGHKYDTDQDKLVLFFPDGGIQEIVGWKNCCVKLGTDWVLAVKKGMEDAAGQAIPLSVGK